MGRGREAEKPTEITAPGWKDIFWRVKNEIAADHVGLIAAGVAFYGLLALFPAITAVMALSGLLVEPSQVVETLKGFEGIVPEDVMSIITKQATAVAGSKESGLGLTLIVGLLLAIYSASKGMASLMEGMNVAYDEDESRGFFVKTAVKLSLTLFLILGLILGLMGTTAVPAVIASVELGAMFELIGTIAVWVFLALMTMLGLAVLYRYGPSRDEPEWRWVSPGAIIACILWIVGSAGFAFYVGNFASYNESFGALAGVVVLLMWFWISAFIILIGAELNSEMEAQTRYDTTTGKPHRMGNRDAVKADNLGESYSSG